MGKKYQKENDRYIQDYNSLSIFKIWNVTAQASAADKKAGNSLFCIICFSPKMGCSKWGKGAAGADILAAKIAECRSGWVKTVTAKEWVHSDKLA